MSDEHSSFIKTPKQLAIVVVLAFAIPIALIGLLSQLVTGMKPPGNAEDDTQLLSRIKPFGEVVDGGRQRPERQSHRRAGFPIGVQDVSRAGDRRRAEGRRQGGMGAVDQEGLRNAGAARHQRIPGIRQGHAPQGRQPGSRRCRSAARGGLHGQPIGREFQGAPARHLAATPVALRQPRRDGVNCHRARGRTRRSSSERRRRDARFRVGGARLHAGGTRSPCESRRPARSGVGSGDDAKGRLRRVPRHRQEDRRTRVSGRRREIQGRCGSAGEADAEGQGGRHRRLGNGADAAQFRRSPTATSRRW